MGATNKAWNTKSLLENFGPGPLMNSLDSLMLFKRCRMQFFANKWLMHTCFQECVAWETMPSQWQKSTNGHPIRDSHGLLVLLEPNGRCFDYNQVALWANLETPAATWQSQLFWGCYSYIALALGTHVPLCNCKPTRHLLLGPNS